MWEHSLPDESDHLRQGDLLHLQAMPKRGGMQLTDQGLESTVKAGQRAVVLERCCSVEQKRTLLLAKVGRAVDGGPEHQFSVALRSLDPTVGPYAYYEHLLNPLAGILPQQGGKLWIVQLLERISIAAVDHDQLQPFRARRVARMTVPARAQLRAKLAAHWARPEAEDAIWLDANGFNAAGVPPLHGT